ncbi:MAG: ribosome assembly RNA-binding protein YhbY [Gammaproteobacteria bacterium]|nr:ribosome assembly RNA-binding protein YhbY [Gammaproteobacteria bacterium]
MAVELELTSRQRRYLRGLAHHLRPIVQIGQAGITEPVLAAIDEALNDHELIKVKLAEAESKKEDAESIASACTASVCGLIGHTAILYRRHPENPKVNVNPSR